MQDHRTTACRRQTLIGNFVMQGWTPAHPPPRVRRNHFSQFIISCLFHWLTRSAAGACVAAANWTAGYVARSGGGGLRRGCVCFSDTFSAICHASSFYGNVSFTRPPAAHRETRSPPRASRLPLPLCDSSIDRSQRGVFFRVTTGTRPCEAVTDWTPRVTRVMMRAQHARLNGLVLAEHLGIRT